jgi:hypothetical protein
MRIRMPPGAVEVSGLNGDRAAGRKTIRSSAISSNAACATSRWPRCTGSNDPP